MLSQRFVSVRNILRLWHIAIWNSFPLAMFRCLLGPCYQYQLQEVLPFSWVEAAGKAIRVDNSPCSQETGAWGGVGRSEGWWAGAYWEVLAAKVPVLSNCSLRYRRAASCRGAACSFFCRCTANPGNAARPGDEELRMHVKQQAFAQHGELGGERPARGRRHRVIVKAVISWLLWTRPSMQGEADPLHAGGLHGLQEHTRYPRIARGYRVCRAYI